MGTAQAALNTAAATVQQTGDQNAATEAIARGRTALIDALGAFGITGAAAESYADTLGLIPSNIPTAVELNGVDAAEARIAYLTRNRNIAITTTVNSPNGAAFLRLGVLGASRPSYAAAGYGGSSGGYSSTRTIAPVVNQNGVFYSYDPSRMAKDVSRKQSQALALNDS